jgi:hypothetical protein
MSTKLQANDRLPRRRWPRVAMAHVVSLAILSAFVPACGGSGARVGTTSSADTAAAAAAGAVPPAIPPGLYVYADDGEGPIFVYLNVIPPTEPGGPATITMFAPVTPAGTPPVTLDQVFDGVAPCFRAEGAEDEVAGEQAHYVCPPANPFGSPGPCFYELDKPYDGIYTWIGINDDGIQTISFYYTLADHNPDDGTPDGWPALPPWGPAALQFSNMGAVQTTLCGVQCPQIPIPPNPPQPPCYTCIPDVPQVDVSPLVLDFAVGSPITFLGSPVPFDFYGDGTHPLQDWISPAFPFLALDIDGDGIIDNGKELFGTATLLGDGSRAPNGFIALGQYDENGDGVVDGRDAIFSSLRLWFDSNSDGVCQPAELVTLTSWGVTGINLNDQQVAPAASPTTTSFVGFTSTFTNEFCPLGPLSIADVWFATSTN